MTQWFKNARQRWEKSGTSFGRGCLVVFCGWVVLSAVTALGVAPAPASLHRLMGARDACLLAAPDGRLLVSIHPDRPLVPASTLKILTALTAYHYLGEGYRFRTDFFMDAAGDLKVKGYGDPLLISEVLTQIAGAIRQRLGPTPPAIRNLVLDTSYFVPSLSIPGVTDSFQPYDAPNGALCANFNTVAFRRLSDGTYVSAEPQTPLLPSVLPRIREADQSHGRILLTERKSEAALYMGRLLAYFMGKSGIPVTGKVRLGTVNPATDRRLLSFVSPYSLDQTVAKLLAYSNNFIANQLLITAGAKAYGPPGTLEKGVRAAMTYATGPLAIRGIKIVEGSGISRENRVTARIQYRLLKVFFPHHGLMRQTEHSFYKTGTLEGISNRVGFFKGPDQRLYPFVVLLNGSPESMDRILDILYGVVMAQPGPRP